MSRPRLLKLLLFLTVASLAAFALISRENTRFSLQEQWLWQQTKLGSADLSSKKSESSLCSNKSASLNVTKKPDYNYLQTHVILYVITPTYPRMEQIPDMIRLGQTLKLIPNLLWLVVDDTNIKNLELLKVLDRIGVEYQYDLAPMPRKYQSWKKKPRGVSNRNFALQWLLENGADDSVFYFADDDNSYEASLFEEIRKTTKVGVFPVGLITTKFVSTPIVEDGVVVGFFDGWMVDRKFPMDMAGFSVNLAYYKKRCEIADKPILMPFKPGYEEDGFLIGLGIAKKEMEPLANNCTEILVWHTQTKVNSNPGTLNYRKHPNSNLKWLAQYVRDLVTYNNKKKISKGTATDRS